jgi:hypothetical protein
LRRRIELAAAFTPIRRAPIMVAMDSWVIRISCDRACSLASSKTAGKSGLNEVVTVAERRLASSLQQPPCIAMHLALQRDALVGKKAEPPASIRIAAPPLCTRISARGAGMPAAIEDPTMPSLPIRTRLAPLTVRVSIPMIPEIGK